MSGRCQNRGTLLRADLGRPPHGKEDATTEGMDLLSTGAEEDSVGERARDRL